MRRPLNTQARKWTKRFVVAALVSILFVPLTNILAERLGARLLGGLIQGEAKIQNVRIGFSNVLVEGVSVWSPDCNESTLALDRLSVDLSLINGIRNGVWISSTIIERPEIHLHFDEAGRLLTKFPTAEENAETSKPISTIPIGFLSVANARLVLHQVGRDSLDVDGISLRANGTGSKLSLSAIIPNLFHGNMQLLCDLDVATMDATSTLDVVGLQTNSERLTELPLLPAEINSQPWSLRIPEIQIRQTGPITPKELVGSLRITDLSFSIPGHPDLIGSQIKSDLLAGILHTQIHGQALGGTFHGTCKVQDFSAPTTTLQLKCQGFRISKLPPELIPKEIESELSTDVDVVASLVDELIQLKGSTRTQITRTNVYGVHVAPTTADVFVHGALDVRKGPKRQNRSTGHLTGTLLSDGVSLKQLAAPKGPKTSESKLQAVPIPDFIRPSGQVRAAAQASIPLASLLDVRTYLVEGKVDATDVEVNDIFVENGQGQFRLAKAQVSADFRDLQLLDRRNGEHSSLSFAANGGLEEDANVNLQLRINRLAASTLARMTGLKDRTVDGSVLSHAVARCPGKRIGHLDAWRGNAVVQARSILVDGHPVAHCEARAEIGNGQLALTDLAGVLAEGELSGSGTASLTTPFPFQGDASVAGINLGLLTSLANPSNPASATGQLRFAGQCSGSIHTKDWQAQGQLAATKLQFGPRTFDDTVLNFQATPEAIVAQAPPKGFLGGDLELTLTGFAAQPGESSTSPNLRGRIIDLPLEAIARITDAKVPVEGRLSAELNASRRVSTTGVKRENPIDGINADFMLGCPAIAVDRVKLQEVKGNIRLRNGKAEGQVFANGLGGQIDIRARTVVNQLFSFLSKAKRDQLSQLPVDAWADVSNVKLQELWPILDQRDELRPLRGSVSASFQREQAERSGGTVAVGNVQFRDLRWENVPWSNLLSAELLLTDNFVDVRRFGGPFAGGRIHGRARVTPNAALNGSFELSTSRISLRKALVPVDRRGELASGLLSIRAQGRLGPRPSGRATISMDRGTAGPIALAQLRVPFDFSVDRTAKTVQWRTSNAGVELGGGRIVTNARGRWSRGLDLTLTSHARRVDTGRIMAGNAKSGGGFLDGTLRLSAKRATAAKDFKGNFDATLSDANSLQIPVVSDLTKFLKTLPTTTAFDQSRIQGRLGNGMVHLDRVTLAAANAQILAEGTATLQGRLNLQVMAKTDETGPADKLLELADSPLLMAAPTPLALVAKANNALKDRVIHLRIGGTAARPVIRLEPGKQIGQEAIKFFMNQAIAFRNPVDDFSFR